MKHIVISLFILCSRILLSQPNYTGIVEGTALDQATRSPLVGANIIVMNTSLGAVTDPDGRFIIKNIPVGNYSIQFRMLGYATVTKTDIIIRSQRTTTVNGELSEQTVESDQVVVTAGYFHTNDVQPVSITSLSAEEIRRAPGSGGDISRVIMGLPSLAKVNDQSNSLIVRGGSPLENGFFLDGIEIQNINHFPTQGATGGPIGMINIDLIDEVNFAAGGFSASHGDKLSSVLQMSMREGNRKNFEGQLDLNVMGFGGVVEGPLGEHGSILLSVRRSYLDYVVKMFDIGTTAAPQYGDVQGKIVYDLSQQHKVSFVFLGGDDHNNPDRTVAEENDMLFYGNQDIDQNAGGLVWRALWNNDFYSNTSLGVQRTNAEEDFFETNTGLPMVKNHSTQTAVSLRNSNRLRLSEFHSLEFGIESKQLFERYDNAFGSSTSAVGDSSPASVNTNNINAAKLGAFITYIVHPFSSLTVTVGTRADYFSYNERMTVSPRASLSLSLSDVTTFNLSSGMFYQNMPLSLLLQDAQNTGLRDPYAVHYIAGVDHLLNEETKFTAEVYQKEYYDFPVDPTDPSLFLVDEMFYRGGLYFAHGPLLNSGKARSRGLELTLQKKLAEELYGLASITLFRTEYQGADGVWRRRVFDNQMIVSIEGGYKPSAEWEFSARWIYAGGTPFTPLDLTRSAAEKRAVFDPVRINGERYPAYHSLNIRFDKRFHFENSNLVVYLSAWNAYNQKNIAAYFWNEKEGNQDTIYQWNLLPIFGVEYEL